jgi:hypothetical protein
MLMILTPLPVWCDPGDSHRLMIIPMIYHQQDLLLPYHHAAHPRYLIWLILSRINGQVDWLKYVIKRTSLEFRDRGSYIYFLGCLTTSIRAEDRILTRWGTHDSAAMLDSSWWSLAQEPRASLKKMCCLEYRSRRHWASLFTLGYSQDARWMLNDCKHHNFCIRRECTWTRWIL